MIEEAAPTTGAASFTVSTAIRAGAETAPRRGCSLFPPLRGILRLVERCARFGAGLCAVTIAGLAYALREAADHAANEVAYLAEVYPGASLRNPPQLDSDGLLEPKVYGVHCRQPFCSEIHFL